jgi:hypothetical protein
MDTQLLPTVNAQSLFEIGRVAIAQVAPSSLKSGVYPDEIYSPAPLTPVETLLLSPRGAVGVTPDGRWLFDTHHADHPQARRWGKDNGISVGFSSQYAAMRARFGAHMADGCAAENLVVASDKPWGLDDLAGGLFVRQRDGALAVLAMPLVATPCVPFARFAAGDQALGGAAMRDALRFLNHGRRGFYLRLVEPLPVATVRPGDPVYLARRAVGGGGASS